MTQSHGHQASQALVREQEQEVKEVGGHESGRDRHVGQPQEGGGE